MKTGVTQLVCTDLSTPDFLTAAADAGYQTVELAMLREGDLTVDTDEDTLRGFADHARQVGVELVSMCHTHTTGNLLDTGAPRDESMQQTVTALQAANTLGITNTLHTLGRLGADLYYDDAYRNGVESLKQLVPVCDELNVDIALEFVWNGFLFSPLEYKRFIEDVGSPRVGFYHDPGNMVVFQHPNHWVRILAEHLKMVHLKDWKGGPLNGEWTALLQGEIDFTSHMRELRDAGYDGPLISEVEPNLADLDATARAIEKIITM